MHAKDLAANGGSNGKRVENVDKRLPDPGGRAPLALIVKPVDLGNAGTLVVAAQQENILRIADLKAQKQ